MKIITLWYQDNEFNHFEDGFDVTRTKPTPKVDAEGKPFKSQVKGWANGNWTAVEGVLTDQHDLLTTTEYEQIKTIFLEWWNMNSEPKQVIVMRKDLHMRKGKMVAQGAHASLGVLLHLMEKRSAQRFDRETEITIYTLNAEGPVKEWLEGKFTKVCVSVDSEQELLDVYKKAQDAGLPSVLITDSGLTEFNGVPTNTCCAIGPWRREEIDAITGHLKLL